jgi:hypothetical protein
MLKIKYADSNTAAEDLLLIEMCARYVELYRCFMTQSHHRCIKSDLFAKLRKKSELLQAPYLEEPYRTVIVNTFNLVFGEYSLLQSLFFSYIFICF